ncbi:SPT2-domain-containing protein [Martensiomyces pterosporus]|nr:SPT2-domain-containing protein [Martensiomyces pterosporus]
MRLAEQNTVDIQRMSLQRKRQNVDAVPVDKGTELEAREKRRKIEIERRVRQRDAEEKQRQERVQAALEKRRREKIESERAEEARRKQAQLQRHNSGNDAARQGKSAGTPAGGGTKSRAAEPRNSAGAHHARSSAVPPAAAAGAAKKPSTQPLSYDQLMRIASGESGISANTVDKVRDASRSPSSTVAGGGAHARARNSGRSDGLAPARHPARHPSPDVRQRALPEAPQRHTQSTISSRQQQQQQSHVRSRGHPVPTHNSPSHSRGTAPLSAGRSRDSHPARKEIALGRAVAGVKDRKAAGVAGADPRTKARVAASTPSPTRAAGSITAKGAKQTRAVPVPSSSAAAPQERARREPIREIDRFGVRPGSSAARSTARGVSRDQGAVRARVRDDRRERPLGASRSAHGPDVRPASRTAQPASSTRSSNGRSAPSSYREPPRSRGHAQRPNRGRIYSRDEYEDDGSEYDSLDDFIVDDEDEAGGRYRVGSIREMLGVKYHDVDDDDDYNMESSAMQQLSEERRSARIGRMEDAEEERRLEEEERQRERRRRMRER